MVCLCIFQISLQHTQTNSNKENSSRTLFAFFLVSSIGISLLWSSFISFVSRPWRHLCRQIQGSHIWFLRSRSCTVVRTIAFLPLDGAPSVRGPAAGLFDSIFLWWRAARYRAEPRLTIFYYTNCKSKWNGKKNVNVNLEKQSALPVGPSCSVGSGRYGMWALTLFFAWYL